jgi:CheY-like chemotaxis protein
MLHFAVTDTGIGIPRDKHASIFEAFSQADGSTTRRFGGTGLGLTISSTLVQMMGGRIWVESQEGRGSAFHFTAAFKTEAIREASSAPRRTLSRSRAAIAPPARMQSSRQRRVLLAEDNMINQRVVVGLLTRRGHEVVVANNGREAIAALDAGTFDLVLMDVQMPEMGGFEATAEIRRRERGRQHRSRIVAMTAHAMSGDSDRCLQAGMDAYLSKPIDPEALFAVVEQGSADEPALAPALNNR